MAKNVSLGLFHEETGACTHRWNRLKHTRETTPYQVVVFFSSFQCLCNYDQWAEHSLSMTKAEQQGSMVHFLCLDRQFHIPGPTTVAASSSFFSWKCATSIVQQTSQLGLFCFIYPLQRPGCTHLKAINCKGVFFFLFFSPWLASRWCARHSILCEVRIRKKKRPWATGLLQQVIHLSNSASTTHLTW